MAEYLHLFSSASTFNDAYANDYKEPWVSYTVENSGVAYNKKSVPPTPHDYSQDYLTLVFQTTGSVFVNSYSTDIYLSKDSGQTWVVGELDSLNPGDKVLVKGDLKQTSLGEGEGLFSYCTGQYSVEGNVMSIYDQSGFRTRTTFDNNNDRFSFMFAYCSGLTSAENLVLPVTALTDWCYQGMFNGCYSLTSAPELPATTLASNCYNGMFMDCSSLTTAPVLPATTLAESCYGSMFSYCTTLTTAPELPATILAEGCYYDMFNGCSSLNYIKCLATNISANGSTSYWVSGVASTGTFVKPSSADWSSKTGYGNGIPENWTVQDAN